MQIQAYRKFLFHISIICTLLSLLAGFYEDIFGLIGEGLHLLMELVEEMLDQVVEHVFHTELHDTQMIVFYILLALGGIIIYFAWKALVGFNNKLMQIFKADWLEFKTAAATDWESASTSQKAIVISVFVGINLLILTLMTCCLF